MREGKAVREKKVEESRTEPGQPFFLQVFRSLISTRRWLDVDKRFLDGRIVVVDIKQSLSIRSGGSLRQKGIGARFWLRLFQLPGSRRTEPFDGRGKIGPPISCLVSNVPLNALPPGVIKNCPPRNPIDYHRASVVLFPSSCLGSRWLLHPVNDF